MALTHFFHVPALLLLRCEVVDRSLCFSDPQFPHLEDVIMNRVHGLKLLWGLDEVMWVKLSTVLTTQHVEAQGRASGPHSLTKMGCGCGMVVILALWYLSRLGYLHKWASLGCTLH